MHRISRAPVLSATFRRDSCWIIDQRALSRISTRRHRFVRLSGRLSTTRTVSPTFASLSSSWARRVDEERTVFLYIRCWWTTSMRTVIVLSALSETTTPWRTFRTPADPGTGGCAGAPDPSAARRSRLGRLRRRRGFLRGRRLLRRDLRDRLLGARLRRLRLVVVLLVLSHRVCLR